ncbi:rod shape-determining protein MreC [Granulicella mallensis]|uniref:Cell shape-determining protein MreC n=1 Tax=Granulicella mallensis (strain ATCC BAA-1857 / DSM 23137 / MP5ACTX8) TaxID=682795 RepID=G8NP41_GRAMM|nr:rod shape-determining protein MreC [Granulicella mallensis]AEU38240.1 rod shape-determining protein MreC [Granulicella mallensis MP5ACTX8]
MDSFFVRFKNPLVLIVIVLAQTIGLAIQVQPSRTGAGPVGSDGRKMSLLRYWSVAIVTPFERVIHGSSLNVRHVWSNYIDLRHTREQNQALQLEIARLRQEQASFAEDAAQGRRLQALLAFKQQYITSTVAAQVIGTSGTDHSGLLYLDKGSAEGLKPGQPVITPDGVVGKLRDVFPHTAQLLLLSDPTSGAGVLLESTRIRAILRGTPTGNVQIDNLTADSRIKPGEKIITSGGDQVFPRGLTVGVIESIASDPLHLPYTEIVVHPAANLLRLEEVLIITGTATTMPAAAQQDAAIADAVSEENKRAADIISEKLPSLNADTPAAKPGDAPKPSDQIGGVPGVPNSGLPRTQPPLHPDRFSPGTTPSAQELKPGAAATPQQP